MIASQQQSILQATVPALYLQYLPEGLADRARDFFIYGTDFLPLAAGATATQNISIQDDSHFLIVAACASARTDAAPPVVVPDPALLVRIEDTGSGRNLDNRAQDYRNVFGSGQFPAYWPYPKLINRASVIATTLTNNQGAALQVRVSYLGFKIFGWKRGT